MPIETLEIFLASSFDEHRDLRSALRQRIDDHPILPLRAIDLDDRRARHRPPLRQSLEAARRSDVTVVLLGTTYGGCPPGAEHSYTHLEYREASAGGTGAVLVYLIGYEDAGAALAVRDPRIAAWCREILEDHTPAFFAAGTQPEAIVEAILLDVQAVVFLTLSEPERRALDAYEIEDGQWEGPSRQELESLAERFELDRDPESRPRLGVAPEDPHLAPARTAAFEQQKEAFRALDLGERSIAALHLRRALDLVPLDQACNYWLARLLLTTGRRQDCREALSHALRASRLARTQDDRFNAALALLAASRAAGRLGDHDSAVAHANAAIENARWYAGCHLELAARQAERGDLAAAEESLEAGFFRHPPSALRALHREAGFRGHPAWSRRLREQLTARVETAMQRVLAEEERTADALGMPPPPALELAGRRILPLLAAARESVLRQVDMLRDLSLRARRRIGELRGELAARDRELADLEQEQGRQREHLATRRPGVRFEGFAAGFLLGLLAAAITQQFMPIPLAAIAGVGVDLLIATWRRRRFAAVGDALRSRQETARDLVNRDLARSRTQLDELARHLDEVLSDRLTALEGAAAVWAILSPTRGLGTARAGDLIRLNPDHLPEDYEIELDPLHLPPDLRDLAPIAPPPPGQRLFRMLRRNGDRIEVARWAVVFPPAPGGATDARA
jgi:hypothetical protein